MKYILAYGSLREGEEWFKELNESHIFSGQIRKVKTVELEGFQVYKVKDLEIDEYFTWTAAKYPGNKEYKIQADIIAVSDKLYQYINEVIKHSNFIPLMINIQEYSCVLYLYNGSVYTEDLIINNKEDGISKTKEENRELQTTN